MAVSITVSWFVAMPRLTFLRGTDYYMTVDTPRQFVPFPSRNHFRKF